MLKFQVATLALALALTSAAVATPTLFDSWAAEHGRVYPTLEERSHRLAVFESNVKAIKAHNADPTATWTMDVNAFADMTASEFAAFISSNTQAAHRDTPAAAARSAEAASLSLAVPDSINWVTKGVPATRCAARRVTGGL